MTGARLRDVLDALEAAYPPALAESWDAVGLVCGDPDEPVSRVLVAVDPVPETVEEAVDIGAQLLVTHHPLLLHGVHGVPADHPKGRLVHRLVRAGVGLFTAHTNADSADPGVSDALAEALGVHVEGPLQPRGTDDLDKIVTFVPVGAATSRVLDALAEAGAGQIGDYSHCAWSTEGTGQFLPHEGANPAIGAVGALEHVAETRLELVLPRGRRRAVLEALRAAHPYEEPAFDLFELAEIPGRRGLGRVGELAGPESLAAFTERAAAALPATAWGVRAAGDPERTIRRVAVCGGAGDSALAAATAAGVDVYLTADLRHHPAGEHLLAGTLPGRPTPALVDVAHWASEHPWCEQAAGVIRSVLRGTVDVSVSWQRTDPWTVGARAPGSPPERTDQ
ncbi:MAG TPA: Nif3-like dinuclear metal center hexameric protein [Pseudonocardia sp.]|nr:Nif3-like dinuclear metal center hexameric protein [Pseudonocardia sp.]